MDDRSNREIARQRTRVAGERSAKLAAALMKLSDAKLKALEIEDHLRETIEDARRITSHIARRRAERSLAGSLRSEDLPALEAKLEALVEGNANDARSFQLAEQWRARLIEEGSAAAAEMPGEAAKAAAADEELPRLIAAAKRERDTGKPPGAARVLFRRVNELLKSR
ncbi:MAG TPA: ribosome biogenesis factor YjgA [Kofleriaceae bacterium]